MARSSATIAPGRSLNPSGLAGPERRVSRSVSEALRGLLSDEDFGRALLAIAAGVDPFAKERKKDPDGVPGLGALPLDWQHRMAALKMYAEYSRGKPLQGVIVQADIDQRIALESTTNQGPIDFASMPPAVRAALRLAAASVLGRALPIEGLSAGQPLELGQGDHLAGEQRPARALARPIDVDAEEVRGERAAQAQEPRVPGSVQDLCQVAAGGAAPRVDSVAHQVAGELDDVLGLGGIETGVHVDTVAIALPGVKAPAAIALDFPGSTNLHGAELGVDGILTVTFLDGERNPGRRYRYRNVTPAMMDAWRAAPSAGAWFSREIRAQHQRHPVVAEQRLPGAVL